MKLNINIRKWEQAKSLRREGNIPAIVYGKHLSAPISIFLNKNEFIKKFRDSGYSTALTLEWKDVSELVLVQNIQLDPVSDVVLHVDFLAVKRDEKVKTEVSIIVTGEAPVEKLGDGRVQLVKDFIEVEAFPQDLPNQIELDISEIKELSDVIFVKDLKLSDKVEVLDDPEQAILTVLTLAVEEEVEEETTEEWEEWEEASKSEESAE